MDWTREFRQAFRPGTKWTRVNHVNPRAKAPVEITVMKADAKEAIFSFEDAHGMVTSYLTWPHLIGMKAHPENGSWNIYDSQGRLILTYTQAQPSAAAVVEELLRA